MALPIDYKVAPEQVEQFASQLVHVPKNVRESMVELFSGVYSKEYYEGLLAAYANMYVLAQGAPLEDLRNCSGQIVAFVADYVNKLNKQEQNSK
ncbi:MAG: hypothetical protein PHH54_00960 [Candidatus Nanoarchaeia archaeon]|nr:hypothetical protein [Candidatus Nanoarchaeia archaeon]MDD5740533.1 hypothetical protein [Candidatus Nanoarchaeia archaeon]